MKKTYNVTAKVEVKATPQPRRRKKRLARPVTPKLPACCAGDDDDLLELAYGVIALVRKAGY